MSITWLKVEIKHFINQRVTKLLVIFLVIIASIFLIGNFPDLSIFIGIIGVVLGVNWLIKNSKYYE